MPRSGVNGTYTLPGAQKTQQPLTPIPSAVNNQGWEDVEQTFNTPTPIAYGGTNAGTVLGAQQNLGLEPGVDIPSFVDTRRNRIVNGDKLVSQEHAQTAGTTNGRYISDQNAMFFVSSNGVFTGVNVAGRTSPAGGNRDRITITTADSALAAGEFLTYTQNIEGSNVGDLKWGTANAAPLIVRRGIRAPQGTWPVAFHNSASNRSYVTTFTVSAGQANTDLVHEFAIPGDTTGTWLTADGVIGLTMDFVIGAGSTFQGVAGWQAGNMLTVAGATNGMGIAGAVFEFFDEGMKADPQATGVYGQYEVGDVDAVYRSERYIATSFPSGTPVSQNAGSDGAVRLAQTTGPGSGGIIPEVSYAVTMCKLTPTLTIFNPSANNSQIRALNLGADWTSSIATYSGARGHNVQGVPPSGTGAGTSLSAYHYMANARL